VAFNVDFLDTLKPSVDYFGTELVDVVVDHLDQPNPEGFHVYIFRRSDGQRLSGDFSWTVAGFARSVS